MGTSFYNTKTECQFLTRKYERPFLVKNYNSTVQQNCEAGNYIDNNNVIKGVRNLRCLAGWWEHCTYACFDCCHESLKTNMAAFRWHMCSFQRLHEDSDIFLFWLDLDFFKDITLG